MTVSDLLKAVIIGNANDAVAVLAEGVSGSVPAFVMEMNARAFDLGMHQTIFTNPQGYDDENSAQLHGIWRNCARDWRNMKPCSPIFRRGGIFAGRSNRTCQ